MGVEQGEEHSHQLRTIVENAPIVLFSLDADGVFELSKGRGLEALGLEAGEVVGESAFDVYAGVDNVLAKIERALTGEAFSTTVRLNDRTFEVSFQPTYDADGHFVRTTGVAVDVTERTRHEDRLERLNEASRRLSSAETPEEIASVTVAIAEEVIDQPLTVVWEFDSQDDCLQPLAATDSAATFTPDVRDSVAPITAETFEMDVFRGGESVLVEDYQTLPDAAHPETPLRTALFVPLGNHGLLGVGFSTVTELDASTRDLVEILARDAVAALDRADRERELNRKNERLEEFARVISHDLRNPINLIQGHVSLARDAQSVDDHLDTIQLAVNRMERLIENLLALAREGRVVGDATPVDLSTIASEAWNAVDTAEADVIIASDDTTVMADRDRLQQLLENLFSNAVEHGGSQVTVTVGWMDGGFYVEDDGKGLSATDTDKLFDFGHTSTDGGTGLGLAIVREIAEAHGWEITATDAPAGGARFEFTGVDRP